MQTCALDASDAVVCWGRQDDPDWVPPTGAYTQVSVGDQGACAVNTAGELVCWGGYDYIPGPTASIVQVAAGAWHVCVLDLGGYVTCASEKYAIDDSPEGYQFVSIDAGDFGTDGITTASEVVGWNAHASGLDASRTWVQVSLGSGVCMLAADGVIECGGGYYLNMVPSPP